MWKSKKAGGGGNKKRFQYCTDPSGQEILYLRALQGHSGPNPIDPSLQDNVLIPNDFFEYIYHIGCAINLHSITNSGLIPWGQILSMERQTVFFTAVNPMHKNHKDPQELDLTKPRLSSYKQKWKRHQDTAYWVDIQLAQRTGLKFYQTRSNAIIFYDTLPAYCIPKVVVMESGEIIYEERFTCHLGLLQRIPLKIIGWKHWIQKLLEVVETPNKPNQKPKIQLLEQEYPWVSDRSPRRSKKDVLFGRESTKYSTRTVRPVDGPKSIQSCVPVSVELVDKYEDKDENADADQTRTRRPVGGQQFTQLEEIDIDFRVPGLSHAVVKEAEHFRVRELVKKIESHPHREALQADLQQNNGHNPFSNIRKRWSVNWAM